MQPNIETAIWMEMKTVCANMSQDMQWTRSDRDVWQNELHKMISIMDQICKNDQGTTKKNHQELSNLCCEFALLAGGYSYSFSRAVERILKG